VTYDTLEWLQQPVHLTRLYATVAQLPNDETHIRQVATEITDRVEKSGREVYRTSVSAGNEHPLASIIEALLAVLIILGVLVVFLSGSLIANTMSALLNQHLRQIGVMKLVGGRRPQIIGMYLVLILAFGVIALLGAIPLGSWGAYELSRFVAGIINFELRSFRIVPVAVIFQIVIALVVPPIAGMMPVLKGSRTTVQKALSSTGLSSQADKKGWIDRQLERLRKISRPLLISVRNTFRRKGRLALTLITSYPYASLQNSPGIACFLVTCLSYLKPTKIIGGMYQNSLLSPSHPSRLSLKSTIRTRKPLSHSTLTNRFVLLAIRVMPAKLKSLYSQL